MILVDNVKLYTGERSFPDGAVLVEGEKILYAGSRAACPKAEQARRIDGRGGILMPGFYNAHCHGAMTLMRGVGSDLNLMDWLGKIWPIEKGLTPDIVYWGSLHGMMEMLRRGTVAFADSYFMEDQVGRAALDAGIRVNLSRACTDKEGVDSVTGLYRQWQGQGQGRIRVSMGVHGEYTSTPQVVAYAVEKGRALGAGFHIHLSETQGEVEGCRQRHGVSPVRYFRDLGLFDSPTLAAHCVHVDDEDIAILAEKGVWAVHNPASNMKLASGFAPVCRMLQAGVKVALGTDGASSNNRLDMLSDMRLASLLQKGFTGDPTALGGAQAFAMATRTGALAMGWPQCGLLQEGMQADMALLDGGAENLCPTPDLPAAIVYAAQGLNVRMTMVQGKVLYQDGEFPTLDKEKIIWKAEEAARQLGVY